MQDTITVLELTIGMIERRDFHRLGDFQQLQEIKIGNNMINDLFDCEKILIHDPLNTFEVGSFCMDRGKSSDNSMISSDIKRKNTNYNYSQIKELNFTKYFPTTDQELLYIMQLYSGLKKLSINDTEVVSWPLPTIIKTVMKAFLEWALDLDCCCLNLCGISEEGWLVNAWSSCQGVVDTRKINESFSTCALLLVEPRHSYPSGANFRLELLQEGCRDPPHVGLTYGLNEDVTAVKSRAKESLIDLNDSFKMFIWVWKRHKIKLKNISMHCSAPHV